MMITSRQASCVVIFTFIATLAPAPARAQEISAGDMRDRWRQESINGLRGKAAYGKNKSFSMIGDLARTRTWNELLPLAKEQQTAILKLNDLVRESRRQSWLADADYLERHPTSHPEYWQRGEARRKEAVRHARRLVTLGLLNEPQAALVIERHLWSRKWSGLYDLSVQELLGMTEHQKQRLAQVEKETVNSQLRLNLMTVNPEEQKQNDVKLAAIKQEFDSAVKGLLTPSQLEAWSLLAAKQPLPVEPPDLPPSALSDADAARIEIRDLSPTLRALAEEGNALDLSADQKKHLKTLEEVSQDGLLWISLRSSNSERPFPPVDAGNVPADRVAQTRADFVKHAEQVALLGILTEGQAERVHAAIKKN